MAIVAYRVLYAFTDDTAGLVEVKRLDRAEGAPPELVYRWLWITAGETLQLRFRGMQRGALEQRQFEQGELSFDAERAELRLHGLAPRTLIPVDVETLQARWRHALEDFLASEH